VRPNWETGTKKKSMFWDREMKLVQEFLLSPPAHLNQPLSCTPNTKAHKYTGITRLWSDSNDMLYGDRCTTNIFLQGWTYIYKIGVHIVKVHLNWNLRQIKFWMLLSWISCEALNWMKVDWQSAWNWYWSQHFTWWRFLNNKE
jgi:hypothetical protein